MNKDIYYYLNRATTEIEAWPQERKDRINYKHPPKEDETEHAETFDRIL